MNDTKSISSATTANTMNSFVKSNKTNGVGKKRSN